MTTHSYSPLPTDAGYDAFMQDANTIFDREQVDGTLRRDVVTIVYSEPLR